MSERTLESGLPVFVVGDRDRIGAGPWARWLATAVVPDESSARAERGRDLARVGAVSRVTVGEGAIAAVVASSSGGAYEIRIEAPTVPPQVWTTVARDARRNPTLMPGVEGTEQSVHLAHLMETQLEHPLIPPTRRIRRSCTCPDAEHAHVCKHVAAVAFVVAEAIDADPSILLAWRGCEPAVAPASRAGDPWTARPLPVVPAARALPPGAVVKRLGRSGIRVADGDLADALAPAYRAFATLDQDVR